MDDRSRAHERAQYTRHALRPTFMAGSVLGFAFVGVLAFGGVGKHYSKERGQVLLRGSFHFLSIGLSIGGAKLVAHYVQNSIA